MLYDFQNEIWKKKYCDLIKAVADSQNIFTLKITLVFSLITKYIHYIHIYDPIYSHKSGLTTRLMIKPRL